MPAYSSLHAVFGQSHGVRGRRSRPALYRNAMAPAMKPVVLASGVAVPARGRTGKRGPERLKLLRDLYEGESLRAHRFRYGLLVFDLITVAFIVMTSFLPRGLTIEAFDVGFGRHPVSR